MGLILDISPRVLERVLYFSMYIVTDPGNVRELSKMQTLTEKEYRDLKAVSYTPLDVYKRQGLVCSFKGAKGG